MARIMKWQQTYIDRLATLSNRDLWNEFLWAQVPDDYDGEFTGNGQWCSEYSQKVVEERLASWLEEI